ncbi:OsmC family protein [Ferruginibacter lapsinanis]|uniref:OsmC family protein n=1 Tax=Ferruginibacter lapsinanis TaxID=563172 RepID=UPI001E488105|nr:OsmC family protein [Ferruginibacter lapsinanis]UEG50861.1 OsmC family protein [Ferruginibacter lapsinanis]
MKISASIKSKLNQFETTVQTNDSIKEISIPPKASGYGSSINGGELLLLSLATCFCNDIYREAIKKNIIVSDVEVIVTGEFGAEGAPGTNFKYKANVIADATAEEIKALIEHTDKVAEIHNTLRKGINLTVS